MEVGRLGIDGIEVVQVRRKIEPDPTRPRYLLTAPSAGYLLVEPL